ncbi:hypothetical protein [Streptomyces sp. NE06-03C]|uniref:hypothetical protein n=1 Tax=Streptomyces sp. NE06-03C TaxID=3028694 RepID=UPI0029B00E21|nr:hypothetical protein [Streptomyces sp. NE06-03C]MDX2917300.1 hypothetical protein [Streptomyces sp. NE06-03C]
MAACCSAARCTCRVTAGPGVTVDGNGSPAAPYVVSASGATTALAVTDTSTVDLTLTGDGSADTPYEVTAAVVLDPAPPGGGDQLLQSGPDGLFLECEQVRGCLVAGDGIDYDAATGEIAATPAPSALEVTDSTTVDLTLSGDGSAGTPYNVAAAVILDPTPPGGGDQLLQSGPDGLFLECEQVRGCISAGEGAAYDPATGVIEARLSADAGNSVAFGTDGGLYAPTTAGGATELDGVDSTSVDVTVTGTGAAGDPYEVTAAVILDPTPPGGGDQLLQSGPDGLFLECEQVRGCLVAGDGIEYDPSTGEIAAAPAPTALEVTDSATVDLTLSGDGSAGTPYNVTGAVILDPAPPQGGDNLIQAGADGIFLECADVRGCVSAGDGAAYDEATGVISARPSTDPGNSLSLGTDGGLLVPPADSTTVQGGETSTVSTTVAGDGSAGDPYIVTAEVILDPAPPGGGDQLLQSGPDGLFLECEQVRGCVSAGDGAAYDEATGVISARPSTDAGNTLAFGTDGGLLVPTADQLTVGCGLQGEGTPASPLEAFPVAGDRSWSTDWSCDAAANSTLRCDPSTGALWTPPEHTSAAVTMQQLHPLGSPAMPATGTTVIIDSTAWSEGAYDADTLSLCRGVTFSVEFTGHAEVSWTAGAIFDLAYAVSVNGGSAASRLMSSVLTPSGPAGRRRATFSVAQATTLAPHTSYRVRVYPAIRVTTGTVTINQWITDTHLIALTR